MICRWWWDRRNEPPVAGVGAQANLLLIPQCPGARVKLAAVDEVLVVIDKGAIRAALIFEEPGACFARNAGMDP